MAKIWKSISILAVLALVVGVAALTVARTAAASDPSCNCGDICANTTGWWHDGGNFNASKTPIQDAVNSAAAGDTICVKDGTYNENIDVNKGLTIQSENGTAKCVVRALNSNDHVFYVTANGVSIAGLTVQGATGPTYAGIYLKRANHCNITGNNVLSNRYGIYVFSSSETAITDNDAGNNDYGFWLRYSNNGRISNNNASNNANDGIRLDSSSSNNLTGNTAGNNDCGIRLDSSSSNNLTLNKASSNNGYGIWLRYSNNSLITNNNASRNGCGICLDSSGSNNLTRNEASSNNGHGIWLRYSNNSLITNNNASSNTNDGIRLDSSPDNTLTDNAAWDNRYGIYLTSSLNNTLTDNTASNKFSGIRLDSSSNNTLNSNNASSNPGHGFWLDSSSNNTLVNNNASNNSFGIQLYSSPNNTLIGNIMSGNTYNFYVYGDNLSQYVQDIDTSNKVDGKPVCYWVNHRDEQVPGDAGFVGIVNSTNITVKDLNLTKNGQGMLLAYTENSVVENVTVWNNCWDGICLSYSTNNTIANNTAWNNYWGIQLRHSSNNTITHNNVNRNSHYGIDLGSSINNTIYLNNFINNTGNVYSSNSTNTWNPPEEINYSCNGSTHENYLGNYWSDYSGSDPEGDSVGNSPYNILGCCPPNTDNYPLMEPFEAYQPVPYATPPAAVTDLAISKTSTSSITLTWTAPGDDGNSGTASQYDIRYSTSGIDETTWDVASQCAGEPKPQPAGSKETFTLTRRSTETTFYLALKTADEVFAWSQLSNVVTGTTGAGGGGGTVLPPLPAEFTITSLTLSSRVVDPGEPVTITAGVTNIGGSEGSYTLNLTVNGEVEQTKTVTLAPGATGTVAFTITREEPGSYSVSVDGKTAGFVVAAPPPPSRYRWTIVAGIIVAGLLIHFLVSRRRPRPTPAK